MRRWWVGDVALVGLFAVAGRAHAQVSSSGVVPATPVKPVASVSGTFDRMPSRPEARFALAQRYEVGNGTRKDSFLAAHWARLAAEGGSAPAREWLKAGAEGGDPFAQLQLGAFLKDGPGQKLEPKAAEVWVAKALPVLRAAANANEAQAAMALGIAYAEGLGVTADDKEAYAWLWVASNQHYPPAVGAWAMSLLTGKGTPAKPADAVQALEGAATLGNFESARDLGEAYLQGRFLPKDMEKAVKWLRLAAFNGDAESQFKAAHLLEQGEGVARDDASAAELYRLAAAQGEAAAANNLGLMVREGRGTAADPTAAIEWFKQADAAGNAFGAYNLGCMYRDGVGVAVDSARAKALFTRAAKTGHDAAKRALARLDATLACQKLARSTVLFGEPLRCASRSRLRRAIVDGGAVATRENDKYWYDNYDSSQVLEGSAVLSVGYTGAGEFAHAQYSFPGEEVSEVARMVAVKYGVWRASHGSLAVGPASFEWNLRDGIRLRVSRGWPDTTPLLEYIHPAHLARLEQEQAAEDSRRTVEKSQAQSNAF